jgi:hypothetical protein
VGHRQQLGQQQQQWLPLPALVALPRLQAAHRALTRKLGQVWRSRHPAPGWRLLVAPVRSSAGWQMPRLSRLQGGRWVLVGLDACSTGLTAVIAACAVSAVTAASAVSHVGRACTWLSHAALCLLPAPCSDPRPPLCAHPPHSSSWRPSSQSCSCGLVAREQQQQRSPSPQPPPQPPPPPLPPP